MSVHTSFGIAGVSSSWLDVDLIAVVSVSAHEIVVLNSDGSETRLQSAKGDLRQEAGGIAGTVTSVARTSDGGGLVYESLSGVSIGAADLLSGAGRLLDVLLDTAARIGGGGDSLEAQLEALGWHDAAMTAGPQLSIADFATAQASVVAYLDEDETASAPGGGYVVTDVVMGSPFDDWLSGNGSGSIIVGGAGSDTLVGGGGDILVGGLGADRADYTNADGPVVVNLAMGTAVMADGSVDLLRSIENVAGSAFGDWITGNDAGNVIQGGRGDDLITLGGGSDMVAFRIGDGVDTVTDFALDGGDAIALMSFGSITSFAQLVDENRLVTVDGQARVVLGGGDAIVLQSVASHTLLTAGQFRF